MKKRLCLFWVLFSCFTFASVSFAKDIVQFTSEKLPLYLDEQLTQSVGGLLEGVPVKILKRTDKAQLVELTMWRKNKGLGRVWYNQFAKNITDAVWDKNTIRSLNFDVLASKTDPMTGIEWQQVQVQAWLPNVTLAPELSTFWAVAEETFKTECSVCHKQRDTKLHDANEWVAVFKGMVGFTDMDEPTQRQVLRYLQFNASDAEQNSPEK